MKRLRLLIIRNACFSEGPKSLSNELRFLDWPGYPSPSLPSNFHPQKLVTLNMCHGKIKQFEGIKVCENLRKINFSYCEYLTCIPDVSTMANLESLNLNGCGNLVEVHQSLGFLDKLSSLDVDYCSKLGRLPNLKLPLLEFLRLGQGTSIEKFPNILGEIPRLRQITFDNSPIQEFPTSVEHLIGLERITIMSCKNLRDLPRSISKLPRLKSLCLWRCTNLGRFPKSSSSSSSTSSGFGSVDMRLSVGFPALEVLIIFNCDLAEVDFLESFHCFSTLKYLDLSGNNFVRIPACITRFTNLRSLSLEDCEGLRQKNASSGGKSFIENLTMMMPMVYRFCRKMEIRIKVRGEELPEWFRHKTRENEMYFRMPPPKKAELAGLVIGIVFNLDALSPCSDLINIYINGRKASSLSPNYAQLDGVVWLYCFPRGDLEWQGETNLGDCFRVSLEFLGKGGILDGDVFNKRLGVCFVFDNTDDDDDDSRVIVTYQRRKKKKRVDFMI